MSYDLKSIAKDIEQAMSYQGITKLELACRLHCHPSFITKILKGNHNFTVKTLLKIAEELNKEWRIELV